MASIFLEILDEGKFAAFVRRAEKVPAELAHFFKLKNTLSDERIKLAHEKYSYETKRYSEYLDSKNPDHYKRGGALLHALCTNPVVLSVNFPKDDDIEWGKIMADKTAFPGRDLSEIAELLEFYRSYYDQAVALDLAVQCILTHEATIKPISFDTIHNLCHYLKNNNLTTDHCYIPLRMLFA